MKLVDADMVNRKIEEVYHDYERDNLHFTYHIFDQIYNAVKEIPTVDAVPVRHGRWVAHTMSEITGYDPDLSGDDPVCSYSCSVCGEDCYVSDTGDDILSNYCPNCGADMRGEKE